MNSLDQNVKYILRSTLETWNALYRIQYIIHYKSLNILQDSTKTESNHFYNTRFLDHKTCLGNTLSIACAISFPASLIRKAGNQTQEPLARQFVYFISIFNYRVQTIANCLVLVINVSQNSGNDCVCLLNLALNLLSPRPRGDHMSEMTD